MIKSTHLKRVRYAETDKMGFLYYGHYAVYYEIGRAELIRELGITYHDMEEIHQVMLPVVRLECKYHGSAYYDDLLTIESIIPHLPTKMLEFRHRILGEDQKVLNTGVVKLFFVDRKSGKRISCPDFLMEKIETFF